MKKVIIYFLAMVIIQMVCGLVAAGVWNLVAGNNAMTAMQIIVSSSVSNVIIIMLFVLMKWTPFSCEFIKSKPWALLLWSVVIGLGMLIPVQLLEEMIPKALTQDIMSDLFKMVMGNNWGYLAVGLLAPLAEELVFRGAIQKAATNYFKEKLSKNTICRGKEAAIAIAFTALLFAAIHGNPAQMPHAFLVGLLLGWMCHRSGSIVPGIVVHWVNNSIAFMLCAICPESYDMTLTEMFDHSALYIALTAVISLAIFVVGIYQFRINTKEKICYTSTV